MPSRPDLPCAGCGKLMWRGTGSLPEGLARCRACRSTDEKSHGATGYKAGCRCADCREGKRVENLAIRARRKAETGLAQKRRTDRIYLSPPPGQAKPCSECGLPVIGRVRSDDPTHNACRPPRHWVNAIQVSRTARLAIYERDGWVSQLCSTAVDPSLDPQHRMAATLDHITPRSLTLFPDDSPENLRLAHRACNSARGVRAA